MEEKVATYEREIHSCQTETREKVLELFGLCFVFCCNFYLGGLSSLDTRHKC